MLSSVGSIEGLDAAPITPPHEHEERACAAGSSEKSLELAFAAVSLQQRASDRASSCGGDSAETAAVDAYEDLLENFRSGGHDRQEPILQQNVDRFCLLPIK
jgi:hypothetical protein